MTANSFRSWFRKLIGQSRVPLRRYSRTILYVDGSHLIRIGYQREFHSPCAIAQYIACFIDHSLDIFAGEYDITAVKVYFDGPLPLARLIRHSHRMRTTTYPIVGTPRVAEVIAYLTEHYPGHQYYTTLPGEATMQIVKAVIADPLPYPLMCGSELSLLGGLVFRNHSRGSIYDPLARRPFTIQNYLHYCQRIGSGVARDFLFLTTFMGTDLIPLNPYITNPLKFFKAIWHRYQLLVKRPSSVTSSKEYLLDSHYRLNWRLYFKLLQITLFIEEIFLYDAKPSSQLLVEYLGEWYSHDSVPLSTRCHQYLQYLQWTLDYYSGQTTDYKVYYPLPTIPTLHHLYLYLNRVSLVRSAPSSASLPPLSPAPLSSASLPPLSPIIIYDPLQLQAVGPYHPL